MNDSSTVEMSISDAHFLITQAMQYVGYDSAESNMYADHIIDAELKELSNIGLHRALTVVKTILKRKIQKKKPVIVADGPLFSRIDGGMTVGPIVGDLCADQAIRKTRENGMSIVGAFNTWYTSALSVYSERIAKEGFVSVITCSGNRKIAPYGSTQGFMSTNPMSIALPNGNTPIIHDMSTASISFSEIMQLSREGKQLPPGIALDTQGNPTTDPMAALSGVLLPWGGHKGAGLGLMIQLLGGMLANGKEKDFGGHTIFMITFDPKLFCDQDVYLDYINVYSTEIRNSRPLDQQKPVRMPFDRSRSVRDSNKQRGFVTVSENVVNELKNICGIT